MVPPIIYPTNEQKPAIKETVIATMKTLWDKVANKNVKSVDFECLFDESPKVKLADYIKENKYWPSVRRVNDAYGDRNLICSCTPIEAYAELQNHS